MMIGGYRVIESPLLPAWKWTGPIVLSLRCPVSDRFREEFNDWAKSIFGGKREANVLISEEQRMIYAHPRVLAALRNASKP